MNISIGLDALLDKDRDLGHSLDRLRAEHSMARRRATELSERVERLEYQLLQARECTAAMLHVLRSNHLLTDTQLGTLIESLNAVPPEPVPFVVNDEAHPVQEIPAVDLVELAAANEVRNAVEEMNLAPDVDVDSAAADELDIGRRYQKNAPPPILE